MSTGVNDLVLYADTPGSYRLGLVQSVTGGTVNVYAMTGNGQIQVTPPTSNAAGSNADPLLIRNVQVIHDYTAAS